MSAVVDVVYAGDPVGCVIGQTITIETATIVYEINTQTRYDLMLWVGDQEGTDPRLEAGTGESCSVFSLPGPFDAPWGDEDGDQCGDVGDFEGQAERTFTDVPVTCQDNNNDGFADLQILLSWSQQAGDICGVGGANVFPVVGAGSKCDYGISASDLPIIEGPSLELAKTVTNDNGGNDVASSFTLTLTGNDGTHNAGVDYSDGDTPTIVAGVQYTVSETPNDGYTNTSITSSTPSRHRT
ncbi:MAG: hypothetical protein MUE63_09205 [Xanthomonadales bacterium]|nr:hypothetical protein [Xanthomonadales bacterium]